MTPSPQHSVRPAIPYTMGYVQQLLQVDEQLLVSYVHALGLTPQQDAITGALVFSQADVDMLRRALQAEQSGIGSQPNGLMPQVAPYGSNIGLLRDHDDDDEAMSTTDPLLTRQVSSPAMPLSVSPQGDQLSVVVDAVNQVKVGILKDLSLLLDDKLSGLDEVVIELIRAKSDNDTLKQRLEKAKEDNESLKYELSRFKPVQFGFYRKG
jgi:hypothetical protein